MAATNKSKAAQAAQVNASTNGDAETLLTTPPPLTTETPVDTVTATGSENTLDTETNPSTDLVPLPARLETTTPLGADTPAATDITPGTEITLGTDLVPLGDAPVTNVPAEEIVPGVIASTAPDTAGDYSAVVDHDPLSTPSDDLGALLIRAGTTGGKRYTSDRRLFLTPSGAAVEGGHAQARYLLVGPGGSLPHDLAEELGLTQ